ncbi:MAG: class I SAM-dependent rRNA methyltransferase [Acidobacteriota bacterium]|nr:class I SAM-dependent rRNA methyltransferase [Acidobacteriota bacterium]
MKKPGTERGGKQFEGRGVVLKPGREKSVHNRHQWIFSGAIQSFPPAFTDGKIYPVFSAGGLLVGYGYFNRKCSLTGRLVSLGQTGPEEAIRKNLTKAIRLREKVYGQAEACRLVNGESDSLPGLVVDRYQPGLVIQISTLGMENLKPLMVQLLSELIKPAFIYEKSMVPSRKEEGLEEKEGLLTGQLPEPLIINEQGIKFKVYLTGAQKTGFFLDQREMRQLVREIAAEKKVLDGFSYTGGFALSALKGQASRVDLVDSSHQALDLARENMALNVFRDSSFRLINQDMFAFLNEQPKLPYDLVILDPPAFAKKKADQRQASRAYQRLNYLAMSRMKAESFLLTFSCSYYINRELFQKIIFQAALQAGRQVKIITSNRQAYDHPVSIFHPESDYLKGFLLYIS